MLRRVIVILLTLFTFTSLGLTMEERSLAIQTYLNQGKPEQAVTTAYLLLKEDNLNNQERKELLKLIVQAQLIIVKAKHYEDVKPAVDALQSFIREFPESVDEPNLIWQIINLYWNQNNLEEAQSYILDLQNRFPQSLEATKSWLILGKIHFIHKNYSEARTNFLRFAITFPQDSTQGRNVRIWTALVDYAEGRFDVAFKALRPIFDQQPSLITEQPSIYSRYIHLLHTEGLYAQALAQTKNYLSLYKTSSHTPEIRLLHADLLLLQPNPDKDVVIKAYSLIAETQADTVIGKQAFMRKMMLQLDEKKQYSAIKPAIIALKRIANKNQMSQVEDEALLLEARLWRKVAAFDPLHSPKQSEYAALEKFSLALKSTHSGLKKKALEGGKNTFLESIQRHIERKDWRNATQIWQRFTQFRPPLEKAKQLYLNIAQSFRLTMQYAASDQLLQQLLSNAKNDLWREKLILEQAKLWFDRGDTQSIQRIMTWLDQHEYSIYRPEMLLIVAQIQLQNKAYSLTSHTLDMIQVADITYDTRTIYWKTRAKTEQALKRWHMAAFAWAQYTSLDLADKDMGILNEAHARFKAGEFPKAEALYSKVSENLRTPIWTYRYSISQLKNGKWKQATSRLTTLKNNPDAGIYTSMAALTLAERQANQLLENSL